MQVPRVRKITEAADEAADDEAEAADDEPETGSGSKRKSEFVAVTYVSPEEFAKRFKKYQPVQPGLADQSVKRVRRNSE